MMERCVMLAIYWICSEGIQSFLHVFSLAKYCHLAMTNNMHFFFSFLFEVILAGKIRK